MITHEALTSLRPAVPLLAVGGFVLGTAYFASLRRGVGLAIMRRAWSHYLLLGLVRITVAALFFALAARCGLPPLVAAFAGFLLARQLAVRATGRVA